MSAILNAASLPGTLGVGSLVLGDYMLRISPIEGGYRLTVTRGSDVQTMDVRDGTGIARIEKTASVGNVDTYTVTLTDGSDYSFTVTNGTGSGGGANVPLASEAVAGIVRVGQNLEISSDGKLSVVTADAVVQDNTRPITSAAVYTEVGNINALLATI